jgi:hypothetical protein
MRSRNPELSRESAPDESPAIPPNATLSKNQIFIRDESRSCSVRFDLLPPCIAVARSPSRPTPARRRASRIVGRRLLRFASRYGRLPRPSSAQLVLTNLFRPNFALTRLPRLTPCRPRRGLPEFWPIVPCPLADFRSRFEFVPDC